MIWLQENIMMVLMFAFLVWVVWSKFVKPKLVGVKSMSVQDFKALKGQAYTLVDVRSKGEWQGGRAVGAIHIPLHEVKQRLQELPKNKPVICICASGMRSLSAASIIGQAGYTPVYNFSGGMGSWVASSLPTKR